MSQNSELTYQKAYQGLPEELASHYSELNFDNHCYLRIALDNTLGAKWDTKIGRPAYRNLNGEQLESVVLLMRRYLYDEALLQQHNSFSLRYRRK